MKQKFMLLSIFVLYVLTRLYFLFTFPPFTDESLYIRYGQLAIHNPDFVWASLQYLHRQPLAIWIFGFGSTLFQEPLYGARLLVLLINLPVFFCIWDITKKISSHRVAILSILILTFNPLFVFTQSTSLMDGLLFAMSCYILWIFNIPWKHKLPFQSITVGILLGISLWIKSTALILVLLSLVGVFLKRYTENLTIKRFSLYSLLMILVPVCLLLPLIQHKGFDVILSEPNSFVLSGKTVFGLPIQVWIKNLAATCISFLIYFTPVGLLSFIGAISHARKREYLLFTLWWSIPFAITIFLGKNSLFRYSVIGTMAIVPMVAIGLQVAAEKFSWKYFIHTCIGILCISTLLFELYPANYFHIFPAFTGEQSYAIGWPSGYGIPQLVQWIDSHVPPDKTILLAVADSPGNPSDYLLTHYFFSDQVKATFVTLSNIQEFRKIEPLTLKTPIYLATRASLIIPEIRQFLTPVVLFQKPYGQDEIGLYRIDFTRILK